MRISFLLESEFSFKKSSIMTAPPPFHTPSKVQLEPSPNTHPMPGHHLGEVADNMSALPVDLSENVEDKRLHIKVESLVV